MSRYGYMMERIREIPPCDLVACSVGPIGWSIFADMGDTMLDGRPGLLNVGFIEPEMMRPFTAEQLARAIFEPLLACLE